MFYQINNRDNSHNHRSYKIKKMHAHQNPGIIQIPPPPYQQLPDYYRPAEERMANFQQLVGRYESEKKKYLNNKEKIFIII